MYFPVQPTFMSGNGTSTIDLAFYSNELTLEHKILDWCPYTDHRLISHRITNHKPTPEAPYIRSRIYNETKSKLKLFSETLERYNALDLNFSNLTKAIMQIARDTLGLLPDVKERLPKHWNKAEDTKKQYKLVKKLKNRLQKIIDTTEKQILYIRYLVEKSKMHSLDLRDSRAHWYELLSSDSPWGIAYKLVKNKLSEKPKFPFPGKTRDDIFKNLKVLLPGLTNTIAPPLPFTNNTNPARPDHGHQNEHTQSNWQFSTIKISWVLDKINRVSAKKAPGIDGFTGTILRQFPQNIVSLITLNINNSLKTSTFPDCFKMANLVMIPKPGKEDYHNPLSFRPLSLLTTDSKFLEEAILEHLAPIIEQHLHPQQHGFRPGKSTASALLEIDGFVSGNSRSKKALIALDFSGAFDNVLHTSIIEQLISWKVPTPLINIIHSYLSNRSVNLQTHRFYIEKIGTPQGSILAPSLWNIALNSLLVSLNQITLSVAYADDLTICAAASTKRQLGQSIATLIDQVELWSREHNLKISTTKSLILPVKQKWETTIRDISTTKSTKILGILLDSKWNFVEHTKQVISQCRKILDMWKRTIKRTDPLHATSRLLLLKGAIRPKLLYGIELWGKYISTKRISTLSSFDRSAHLMALGAYATTSYEDLLAITRLNSIKEETLIVKSVFHQNPPQNIENILHDILFRDSANIPLTQNDSFHIRWNQTEDLNYTSTRVNTITYPAFRLTHVMNWNNKLRISTHISRYDSAIIAQVYTNNIGENRMTNCIRFPICTEYTLITRLIIYAILPVNTLSQLQNTIIYLQAITNPSGSQCIPIFWKSFLDKLNMYKITINYTGPMENPEIIPRDEVNNIRFFLPPRNPRLTCRVLRNILRQERFLKTKIGIRQLAAVDKWPYKEQVWMATGHGPWPDYLQNKIKRGPQYCVCGEQASDWLHFTSCTRHSSLTGGPKFFFLSAYAKEIARRGRLATNPGSARASSFTFLLEPPPPPSPPLE